MGQALDKALSELNKTYGKGTISRVKDMELADIDFTSSQSFAIDLALGGGYPKGRIIEIYGPESSGKTTLVLHAIAEIQQAGGTAAFVDVEHAFDPTYAQNLGVNVEELIFSQPDNAEQAMEIIKGLADTGEVDLIAIDSVAGMVPKKELEGEAGDSVVGLQARLMSQLLRKIVGTVKKNNVICIFINQLRDKIGVMFGSPETTTGGNALKFYASIRIDIRKIKTNKDGDESVSNDIKVEIKKNKVAPPFRKAFTTIEYGKGIVREAEILQFAVDLDLIAKSGSWYSYQDAKLGQGREAAIETLKENPDILDELTAKIQHHYFPKK